MVLEEVLAEAEECHREADVIGTLNPVLQGDLGGEEVLDGAVEEIANSISISLTMCDGLVEWSNEN